MRSSNRQSHRRKFHDISTIKLDPCLNWTLDKVADREPSRCPSHLQIQTRLKGPSKCRCRGSGSDIQTRSAGRCFIEAWQIGPSYVLWNAHRIRQTHHLASSLEKACSGAWNWFEGARQAVRRLHWCRSWSTTVRRPTRSSPRNVGQ